ncbi:PREDICTED: uncharacterized protein LOC106746543 [Dinoponera quadriceps]|uniref:Uncharacterized protein LOC106746543 n=1 Tax=Dinoponera quadriceps TaxID=609295 RepID=A0A6P3XJU2_DINQU|nr:PREDICTED: uncharacterized protein LOC106746543 [Dinoponera quadriceps]
MSIHVTVNGNPVNIRRGRMVLSDLDQIKKNERDRRRRLRLEQVRQQSKEISSRLLERAKKIAREELEKLEKDAKSEFRQMQNKKIMEIQEKYQEDLEDIGQAHASAALQPDADAILEEEERKARAAALKRGKEAAQRMKEIKQKDSAEVTQHQERLHKVREGENKRAAMMIKQPKPVTIPEEGSNSKTSYPTEGSGEEIVHERLTPNGKSNKALPKKSSKKTKKPNAKEHQKTLSPKPGPSGLQNQPCRMTSKKKADSDYIEHIADDASDEQLPRRTVPVVSTTPAKADKVARYNPEDYTQDTSDTSSISSSSSSSVSDDSSYFSDGSAEQVACKKATKTAVLTGSKVQLYDHDTRQRNVYNTPLGIVERIDIGSEPSAIEAARAMKDVEDEKTHTAVSRKLSAQRRGQDAILREKVRRDYQALIKNLEHLAQEERKLKASQIHSKAEDTHARLRQRSKCQEEHQRKMNRAAKNVLCTADGTLSRYSHLAERPMTSPTPQKKDGVCSDVPHSTWQEPHLDEEGITVCQSNQGEQDSEVSREEQILDMLKKVERQKRLLLKEFGASLPDNVFNASIKPLFEERTPVQATAAQVADTAKPASPEVTVINMSNYNECAKKGCKVKKKPERKSPTRKIEIAVQTSPAEDKSVQVELPRENAEVAHSSRDIPTQVSHPIEPQITVLTPETDDSSNDSTSSDVTGMIIEIDEKEVTVTPKKRKSNNLKVPKRPSPRVYQKIRSTSVSSKATSPVKRFSRSHSSSRLTSPQKKTRCTIDAPDTASRRVDIRVSKSAFNDETDPSLQETRVSIDASAESSQTISGVNDQDGSTGKPYRVRTQMKKWIRIKDTSDTTSTSFASPPPVKPRSMLDTLTNITPILEILDSSANEELRRLRQDISPVSTPETPSPRTMRMPSNRIPHRDKISRMLMYNSNDFLNNDILSSTRKFPLTDPSTDVGPREAAASECQPAASQESSRVCTCKNPHCRLLHVKLDDIHDYALKNCPEMLQKYEDLQNLCAERIASLTDLIERVRNEQKDMDLTLISPSDETSLMQLPVFRPARNDVQAIRKLIESIEAIHSQLAKTLFESQKIIGNGDSDYELAPDVEAQAITSTSRSKSIDTAPVQKSEVARDKAKPKVINDEKVNIQLNRFKMQQKPQAMPNAIRTPERKSWPPCALSLHEEEVIEKLSKEILEQSKSLDKASSAFVSLKGNDETSVQEKMPPLDNNANLKNNILLEHKKETGTANSVQEITKANGFIPILTSIPKVARTHGTVTSVSARPKPPVTLLNAPHWQELESSGHELSTIVEFDTTDTVNKSIKSPTKLKSTAVGTMEDSQKILLKRTTGDAEPFRSAIGAKPSVHVAPLPVQQNQNIAEIMADPTSDMKHSAELIPPIQRSQKTTTVCGSPGKSKNATDRIAATKTEAERDWTDYALEKYNKQLQCNTISEEPVPQAKDLFGLGSSISTDLNNQHKNSQHKTTSTSLNSFSGLSGISEITSSPSSDLLKYASSPEEMETALKKLGLSWAVTTLKKTREASALSSSSNSDITPINTARRMISPTKKHLEPSGLPDISDVSSISIKEANKSTEQAVLLKGRTSTPKFQNSNSNSERSSTTNTSESLQERSDSLTVPNVSLTKTKSDNKQLQSP